MKTITKTNRFSANSSWSGSGSNAWSDYWSLVWSGPRAKSGAWANARAGTGGIRSWAWSDVRDISKSWSTDQ